MFRSSFRLKLWAISFLDLAVSACLQVLQASGHISEVA